MNKKRIFALAFAVLMVLALAACGMKNNDKIDDMSGNGSAMTGERLLGVFRLRRRCR